MNATQIQDLMFPKGYVECICGAKANSFSLGDFCSRDCQDGYPKHLKDTQEVCDGCGYIRDRKTLAEIAQIAPGVKLCGKCRNRVPGLYNENMSFDKMSKQNGYYKYTSEMVVEEPRSFSEEYEEEMKDSENNSEKEYEVESILQYNPNKDMYLVKWVGYQKPTWEPEENINDVDAFHEFVMNQ